MWDCPARTRMRIGISADTSAPPETTTNNATRKSTMNRITTSRRDRAAWGRRRLALDGDPVMVSVDPAETDRDRWDSKNPAGSRFPLRGWGARGHHEVLVAGRHRGGPPCGRNRSSFSKRVARWIPGRRVRWRREGPRVSESRTYGMQGPQRAINIPRSDASTIPSSFRSPGHPVPGSRSKYSIPSSTSSGS